MIHFPFQLIKQFNHTRLKLQHEISSLLPRKHETMHTQGLHVFTIWPHQHIRKPVFIFNLQLFNYISFAMSSRIKTQILKRIDRIKSINNIFFFNYGNSLKEYLMILFFKLLFDQKFIPVTSTSLPADQPVVNCYIPECWKNLLSKLLHQKSRNLIEFEENLLGLRLYEISWT